MFSVRGNASTLRVYTEMGSHSASNMSPAFGGQNAASAIRDSREKEKKDLQDLNDRLASYIEKVDSNIMFRLVLSFFRFFVLEIS